MMKWLRRMPEKGSLHVIKTPKMRPKNPRKSSLFSAPVGLATSLWSAAAGRRFFSFLRT
jgi:hypothetical protein